MARIALLFLGLLSLLLVITPLANAQTEAQWQAYRAQCARKSGWLMTAIDKFCSKGDIKVPSNYASTGVGFQTAQVNIWVSDYCVNTKKLTAQNAVWVPSYWCRRQMWYTCAHGPNKGYNDEVFGGRGCQNFHTQTS